MKVSEKVTCHLGGSIVKKKVEVEKTVTFKLDVILVYN